jgi:hypothetical protein
MDFQFSVVFDKTQFTKFVHEKADRRRSDRVAKLRSTARNKSRGACPSLIADFIEAPETSIPRGL